jgi:hypothetical protein
LERATPPKPSPAPDPEGQDVPQGDELAEPEVATARGKGGPSRKASRTPDARAAKRIKGRTIYLPDDLFERILVQAHRRNRTISEYVAGILDRQVPDHRIVRAGDGDPDAT